MSFEVDADAYGRFMGQYAQPLAAAFAAFAGVHPGQQALDVGCGPGALTAELVSICGEQAVSAVDPSEPFVEAVRAGLPGIDVRRAAAEQLPFDDDRFDVCLAQLVVHFMTDPVAGLTEMARVTRRGGRVAACVWDHAGGRSPLSAFWQAVLELDGQARDESRLAGARQGHLAQLLAEVGLPGLESAELTVRVGFGTFEDWWEPFTLGVGPAGDHVAGLDGPQRDVLRDRCRALLPAAPFEVAATAWAVAGRAG